nr:MAG TPA: hypothetical protein [Caudoviricetes sp.]
MVLDSLIKMVRMLLNKYMRIHLTMMKCLMTLSSISQIWTIVKNNKTD